MEEKRTLQNTYNIHSNNKTLISETKF